MQPSGYLPRSGKHFVGNDVLDRDHAVPANLLRSVVEAETHMYSIGNSNKTKNDSFSADLANDKRLFFAIFAVMGMVMIGWLLTMTIFTIVLSLNLPGK